MTANPTTQPADQIRDIKPPVAIPSGWAWLGWTLGALAILALLGLAWRYWRRRRAQAAIVPPVPAHVRARTSLEAALALIAQPKPFCILVSDTVRLYLEERFAFRAPERTTGEFLRELSASDRLSPEQKKSLGDFLESCDLVKFAKYEPAEAELRGLHAAALNLVVETEPREPAGGGALIQPTQAR
jgi:hypothetical protein